VNVLTFAVTRGDIANYVSALFWVYLVLIFIRILLSWIPRVPYNPLLHGVISFVHDVTDPYLRLFRRFLPPLGGGGMAIDLSPIVAVFVLLIAQAIVVGLIRPG
jgi:YggT family protein